MGSRQDRLFSLVAGGSVRLVFDGGAIGNPGKGYGSFIFDGAVTVRAPIRVDYPGVTTNNQAEYQTLIQGLRAVVSALRDQGRETSDTSIEVWSDSQLLVEQISGRWKIKDAKLAVLADEARALLRGFNAWTVAWHRRSESVRILGH